MTETWLHQIRLTLSDDAADAARREIGSPDLEPLVAILRRHDAVPVNTLAAFENYVAEAEARGPENFPLYAWTKATLEDPAKRNRHATGFALHVGGAEVYPQAAADALEADLQPLVGAGIVTRLSRYDSNPANNPQPPARYRA